MLTKAQVPALVLGCVPLSCVGRLASVHSTVALARQYEMNCSHLLTLSPALICIYSYNKQVVILNWFDLNKQKYIKVQFQSENM